MLFRVSALVDMIREHFENGISGFQFFRVFVKEANRFPESPYNFIRSITQLCGLSALSRS